MMPSPEELKSSLETLLPGITITVEAGTLLVEPKDLLAVCRALKEREATTLDYVSNVTAVDYPSEQRIDMVYHLYSMEKRHGPVSIRSKLNRANPSIASLTSLYRGAEFQEREVYDLFGVTFEGHPDLRRILMWDEFEGFPMRKDYVVENQDAPDGAGAA